MQRISVLLGFSIALGAGCDASSADGGDEGTTGSGHAGRPETDTGEPVRPGIDEGSPGDGDSDGGSDGDSDDTTTGEPSTDEGSDGAGGTSTVTGSSSDTTDSGGTESGSDSSDSGGETMPGECDLQACVADCGYPVPDSDEGFGPCWSPVPEHEPWACPLQSVCPNIDITEPVDESAGAAAACLLDALANATVGRVEYWFGPDEYDNRWGTIFIVGDGTVLLDMYTGGHCGNGGSYGTHPIRTRAMAIDFDSDALTSCPASDDPEALMACAFGAGASVASSPDSLPWLVGECVAGEAACP